MSTQNPAARRHAIIFGREAVDGEVLVKYRDDRASVRDAQIASRVDADAVEMLIADGLEAAQNAFH